MAAQKKKADISKLSFEETIEALENIVRRLEEGGRNNLDASIEDYTNGVELKKHAEKKLHEAKLKVDKIISGKGKPETEPFEIE